MATSAMQARPVGIEPIPQQARTLGFFDTCVLWADLGISFLVMVVGTFLVPGLGLGQAFAAILIGALIGNGLLAHVGQRTLALAVGIWLLGIILYLLIAGLPELGMPGLAPWLGATLPSFLFGLIAYALVGRLVVR